MTVIKDRQARSLEFVSYELKLLKCDFFDDAMKAINDEDMAKFAEVCIAAGIPKEVDGLCDDMHTVLYEMARAGMAKYPDMYVWP